jgi:hypothetical protein
MIAIPMKGLLVTLNTVHKARRVVLMGQHWYDHSCPRVGQGQSYISVASPIREPNNPPRLLQCVVPRTQKNDLTLVLSSGILRTLAERIKDRP